ncbi:MAG: hypothetical protein ABIF85_02880 [Nanoarchaeota archaeon]|nr:hypothetical protein [Nanoarchaeota archaeon]MBU4300133.1 hypothetical protein [Nanoarchaeota archaeon]MBU4451583.1 hypothetical protein [Nanoarchaeota archaeon]MCG2724339.1 hypothetical protein [archaeon]
MVVIYVSFFDVQAIYKEQLNQTSEWNSNNYLRDFNIQPVIDALSLKRGKPPNAAEIARKITDAYKIQFGPLNNFLGDSAAKAGLEDAIKLGIYTVAALIATAALSGCVSSDAATSQINYCDSDTPAPTHTVQPTTTIKALDNPIMKNTDTVSNIASNAGSIDVNEPFNLDVVYKNVFSYTGTPDDRWDGVVSSVGVGFDEDDFYLEIIMAPGHVTKELNIGRSGLFYLDIGYNSKNRVAKDNKELAVATNGVLKVRTRLKHTIDGRVEKELTDDEKFNSYQATMHVSGNKVHLKIDGLREELSMAPSPYITDGDHLIPLKKLLGFE